MGGRVESSWRSASVRRVGLYLVAVLVGMLAASLHVWLRSDERATALRKYEGLFEPEAAATKAASSSGASGAEPSQSGEGFTNRVYAAAGVTLEAFRVDDQFVGYAVVRSHDPRLDVGMVITFVDGEAVEDSAAGGELLIAALRRPDAELILQARSAWVSSD